MAAAASCWAEPLRTSGCLEVMFLESTIPATAGNQGRKRKGGEGREEREEEGGDFGWLPLILFLRCS